MSIRHAVKLIDDATESALPDTMARWIARLRDALIEQGFTREEAIRIVTSPNFHLGVGNAGRDVGE